MEPHPEIASILETWMTFAQLQADQDFCRAFRVTSHDGGQARLRHWTGAEVDVDLDPSGQIAGWRVVDAAPELPAARPQMPIAVRTWGEAAAMIRLDGDRVDAVRTVGDEVEVESEGRLGRVRWRFRVADPATVAARAPLPLGAGRSTAMDPADWAALANRIERELADSHEPVGDLRLAAACWEQVAAFADGDAVPPSAARTAAGEALIREAPERFTAGGIAAMRERLRLMGLAVADAGLDAQTHIEQAFERVREVGLNPHLLGVAALSDVIEAVQLAITHLDVALRLLTADSNRRAALIARRGQLVDLAGQLLHARAEVPALPPFDEVPIPAAMLRAPARVPQAGDPLACPPGWHAVDDGPPALWRHDDGAAVTVWGEDERIRQVQVHEGSAALAALADTGHTLTDAQREQLLAALDPGADPRHAMSRLIGATDPPPWRFRPMVEMDAGEERRLKVWIVDAWRPRRSAMLFTVVAGERSGAHPCPPGGLLGAQLYEGRAAVDQMLRFGTAGAASPVVQQGGEAGARLIAAADGGPEAFLAAVRPRPGDSALAFTDAVAAPIEAASNALWADPPPFELPAAPRRVQTFLPGDLLAGAEPARLLAGGWRRVAPWMRPDRTWALLVGAEGRLEGFVWLGDRWAWFPKAWRLLPASARDEQ